MNSEERARIREEVRSLYVSGTTSSRDIHSALRERYGPAGTSLRTVERLLQRLRADGEIKPTASSDKPRWKQTDKRIIAAIRAGWRELLRPNAIAQNLMREHKDLKVDRWIIQDLQLEMLHEGELKESADDERYRLTHPHRVNKRIPPGTARVGLAKYEASRRKIEHLTRKRKEGREYAEKLREYAEKLRAEAEEKRIREQERRFHKRSPEKLKAKRLAHRERIKRD